MDIPIHVLDWTGSHLLIGSRNGITRLYAVRHDDNTENKLRLILIAEYTAPTKQVCVNNRMYAMMTYYELVIHCGPIRPQQLSHQQHHSLGFLCTTLFT